MTSEFWGEVQGFQGDYTKFCIFVWTNSDKGQKSQKKSGVINGQPLRLSSNIHDSFREKLTKFIWSRVNLPFFQPKLQSQSKSRSKLITILFLMRYNSMILLYLAGYISNFQVACSNFLGNYNHFSIPLNCSRTATLYTEKFSVKTFSNRLCAKLWP